MFSCIKKRHNILLIDNLTKIFELNPFKCIILQAVFTVEKSFLRNTWDIIRAYKDGQPLFEAEFFP